MFCNACGHEQPDAAECQRCGVIVAKYTARGTRVPAPLPPATAVVPPVLTPETFRRGGELLISILAYLSMYASLLSLSLSGPFPLKAMRAGIGDSPYVLMLPAVPVVVLVALGFRRWSTRGRSGTWAGEVALGTFMCAVAAGLVAAGAWASVILASQSRGNGHEIATRAFVWALLGAFGAIHAMPLLALVLSLAVGLAWRRTMTRIESAQAIVLGGCLLLLPLCAMAVAFLSP